MSIVVEKRDLNSVFEQNADVKEAKLDVFYQLP